MVTNSVQTVEHEKATLELEKKNISVEQKNCQNVFSNVRQVIQRALFNTRFRLEMQFQTLQLGKRWGTFCNLIQIFC